MAFIDLGSGEPIFRGEGAERLCNDTGFSEQQEQQQAQAELAPAVGDLAIRYLAPRKWLADGSVEFI